MDFHAFIAKLRNGITQGEIISTFSIEKAFMA